MTESLKRLLIWGAGGHAKVVADLARDCGWEVIGFLEDDPLHHGQPFYGAAILGGSNYLTSSGVLRHCQLIVAMGDNAARDRCLTLARRNGFTVPVLTHPSAVVSPTAVLEYGTVVMAGSMVQADTRIGPGGIINTGASVDHDCVLGRCVHIAPGARLTGKIQVGEHTLVGVGAVVIPRVKIGMNCTIGAGAAVIGDVSDGLTVVGVPARVIPNSSH